MKYLGDLLNQKKWQRAAREWMKEKNEVTFTCELNEFFVKFYFTIDGCTSEILACLPLTYTHACACVHSIHATGFTTTAAKIKKICLTLLFQFNELAKFQREISFSSNRTKQNKTNHQSKRTRRVQNCQWTSANVWIRTDPMIDGFCRF